ncbi:MAG: hypothetical protein AABX53_02390 [Nanoarchaeota archaeon]
MVEQRGVSILFAIVLATLALIAIGLLPSSSFTGFSFFQTSSQSEFDQGVYENVSFNGTAVVLEGANLTGSYLSLIFNTTYFSRWDNVSWVYGGNSPIFYVRVCDDVLCSGDAWGAILLDSPSTLFFTNQSYFQFRADFSRPSVDIETSLYNVSIGYLEVNLPPTINLLRPQQGAVYTSNLSFSLEYGVFDNSLLGCAYSLSNGLENITLLDCDNTTINIPFGEHSLVLYALDTEGLVSVAQSNFSLVENYSELYLISPPSNHVTNQSENELTFYVADADLDQCDLLSDFTGFWGTSSTNDTPYNGTNQFGIDIDTEGTYSWGISCFDSSGLKSTSANRTISLDSLAPQITLSNPSGSFSSRQGIPLSLSVVDASAVTCVYTLTKVGAGAVLVVVMPQCVGTNFNVAQDGDYQLSVSVTDSSGNVGQSSTSFSVSAESSSSEGGSDGGGGGVSVDISGLTVPKLGYGPLPDLTIRSGYSVNLSLQLINQGNRFLNNCTLEGGGIYRDWIVGRDLVSISPGEHRDYAFSLSLPRSLSSAEHIIGLVVSCSELETSIPFPITIIPAEFDFSFDSYARSSEGLRINYSLEDLTGFGNKVSLSYVLYNSALLEVVTGAEVIHLSPNAREAHSFIFELPKDSFGEFTIVMQISAEDDHIESKHKIFLSGSTLTGFAISDRNKRTLSIWGIVLVCGFVIFFVFRYLRKNWVRKSLASENTL